MLLISKKIFWYLFVVYCVLRFLEAKNLINENGSISLSIYLIDNHRSRGHYSSREDSSSLPPAIIAIIIAISVFYFIGCLSCCIHCYQRRRHSSVAFVNLNEGIITNSQRQQTIRSSARAILVQPVRNTFSVVTSQIYPSIYEAPPPSYEVATANIPSMHQSSSSPPIVCNVESSQINRICH